MSEPEAAGAPSVPDDSLAGAERDRTIEVLRGEYSVMLTALTASWSVSMSRTSVFLGVLSAAGVALGFAAQGGGFGPTFYGFALVILPLVLFLGLATFVKQVQIGREAVIYIIGMNRIRRFLADSVPATAPYFVLSLHDDELSLYRNMGAGMERRAPRFRLVFALVQAQGVVAVVCGVVAGATGGMAATWADIAPPVAVAAGRHPVPRHHWRAAGVLAGVHRGAPGRHPPDAPHASRRRGGTVLIGTQGSRVRRMSGPG